MRYKYGGQSTYAVCQRWASGKHRSGKGNSGRVWFTGPRLYSYGTHYLLGYRFDDGTCLINEQKNSVSTGNHRSNARTAARRSIGVANLNNFDWHPIRDGYAFKSLLHYAVQNVDKNPELYARFLPPYQVRKLLVMVDNEIARRKAKAIREENQRLHKIAIKMARAQEGSDYLRDAQYRELKWWVKDGYHAHLYAKRKLGKRTVSLIWRSLSAIRKEINRRDAISAALDRMNVKRAA
jgi:hypothetical protein